MNYYLLFSTRRFSPRRPRSFSSLVVDRAVRSRTRAHIRHFTTGKLQGTRVSVGYGHRPRPGSHHEHNVHISVFVRFTLFIFSPSLFPRIVVRPECAAYEKTAANSPRTNGITLQYTHQCVCVCDGFTLDIPVQCITSIRACASCLWFLEI